MYIQVIDGYATGRYSETKQDWATFEIDKLPENELRYYKVVDGNLVCDENRKIKLKKIDDDDLLKQGLEQYLKNTEWYFIRYLETKIPIPEDIAKKRIKSWEKLKVLEEEKEDIGTVGKL